MSMIESNPYEDEHALVRACVAGGEDTWSAFVDRYHRLIVATARSVIAGGNAGLEVDELVSSVYEKLLEDDCRRMRAWKGRSRFSTYLVQVARNLCIDATRRHKREQALDKSLNDLPEWVRIGRVDGGQQLTDAQIARVRDAIEQLPSRQALIMRMRLEGKSLREIATLLSAPEGTVFADNSRAIESLRTRLRPLLDEVKENSSQGPNV